MAENIQVVVRVRPLSTTELSRGCTESIKRNGREPQITVNNANTFTFDAVYMPDSTQNQIYDKTILPMIDKLFKGFNCAVLAYGQTGSGKTFTMGTSYSGGIDSKSGIIPRVIVEIFNRLDQNVDLSATISCSFLELYQEELLDLLSNERKPLDIREVNKINEIPGLTTTTVNSPEETAKCLAEGATRRATGSTAMNETSSRSHAIFTIHLTLIKGADSDSAVSCKLQLVDLAGSERVSKTKATGERFKEGVKINQGLLSLGNVISTLAAGKTTATFRDSKLTRLLQGSLGGNSVTLMIACVSPADYNLDETLSTLRYADRAKQIKNKPVVNRDPRLEEIARLHELVSVLRSQLDAVGGGGTVSIIPEKQNEKMKTENAMLVNELASIQLELHSMEMLRDGSVETLERLNGEVEVLETELRATYGDQYEFQQHIEPKLDEVKRTLIEFKTLLQPQPEDTVWHDAPSSESLSDTEHGKTFTLSTETFNNNMRDIKKELAMKVHLVDKLQDQNKKATAKLESMKAKIVEKEKEKEAAEALLKETDKSKNINAKLAEERRQKIAAMIKEIAEMKQRAAQQQKNVAAMSKVQVTVNNLRKEIVELKHKKNQLANNMKKEQDKFRQLKIKCDKEMNVMREKEKKRSHELKKMEARHEQQRKLLQRRIEAANFKAQRAANLLNIQKRAKQRAALIKDPVQIEKRLNQELELIQFVSEVKASRAVLMENRTEMKNKLAKLDASVPEQAAKIAVLEADIAENTHTINELQQKIQEYDLPTKAEAIAMELQPEEAVKTLLVQISDILGENYNDKLKWEAAESAYKVRIEELTNAAEDQRKELINKQRDQHEDMVILLDGFLDDSGNGEGLNNATFTHKPGPRDNLHQLMKKAIDEAQSLREENERLQEELEAMKRITAKARPVAKNKNLNRVTALEAAPDSESEFELDNSDADPDWSFSEEKPHRKHSTGSVGHKSSSETTITLNSTGVRCQCKTDCSKKTCSCRKNSLFCHAKCGCKNCVNKDRDSVSDPDEGLGGSVIKRKDDSITQDKEPEQESKRRKVSNNDENVDMNNTQFKYPYLESKPVFYS